MKRKSKEQRIADELTALERRLEDIANGAHGGYEPIDFHWDEFGGMAYEMGLDTFGRWLGGIDNALLNDDQSSLIEPRYLEQFDTIKLAAKHLHKHGVRA